jgi:dipeptidyl-peptidase-4
MFRIPALIGLALLSSCTASPSATSVDLGRKRLTLEQTLGQGERVDFTGELPDVRWAHDGRHLERREGERTVWVDPVTWSESEPQPAEVKAEDDLGPALVAAGVPEARAKRVSPRSVRRAADGTAVTTIDGALWMVRAGQARQLAGGEEDECELPDLSPDGTRVAYVQANDLHWIDLASGEDTAVTSDGSLDVFNGKLDWVYQEELYGRYDFKSFWWSPDSTRLAFLRLDESAVYDFTVIDHIEEGHFRVKPEVTRYPKAGDPNPTVALGVVDVAPASAVRWVDLSAWSASEPLVVRVDWAPDGATLTFQVQDRIQTRADLVALDPATLAMHTVLSEVSEHGWVERPASPRWLDDGSFLWLSSRTGQQHVLRYRLDGTCVAVVTEGDWSVTSIDAVDEARGQLWVRGTLDGAVNDNLYRAGLDGNSLLRLTQGEGAHSVDWNEGRTLFLDRISSLASLPRLRLCDGEGGLVRELGEASAPDLEGYATAGWEHHEIRARDGFPLDVALLKPVDFDPSHSYPVWLPTYSGPDAPSVRNRWNGSTWYQFLAQNGVIVLQVNVRSASGRGQAVTETVYQRLGIQELADLEDAVDWLCANRWADGTRVGITGGSYGGFMSAFALTHSDRFALAIAASGVYDWRMYDTIYTERYMSTPERNPEGYAATSVLEAAANLKGHLILTHGVMDDNVHLQNAIQLIWALQKAGQDFELMLYPQSRHGIGDRDLRAFDRRLTWRAIQEHLLGR